MILSADKLPITVLVPTFNRSRLLAAALASIMDQPRPPAEVIVIDDGSDDDTAAVVAAFGPTVRYLWQENAGKSVALNNGLAQATQDLIWIFDDDDLAVRGGIETLYSVLEADPSLDFCYGINTKFYGDGPPHAAEPAVSYVSDDDRALYITMMEDFFIWQGSVLVRRACYDAVGAFNPKLSRSQDYEMALRLLRRFRGSGVPAVVFHQRHHAGVRGPRGANILPSQMHREWARFNALIFREIYENHRLEEFYGGSNTGALSQRAQVTALIQRSCIMARRGLWAFATSDLCQATHLSRDAHVEGLNLQEITAFRRVFETGASYSVFVEVAEAASFADALKGFGPRLAETVRGNLLVPITNRMRSALKNRDASEWRQIRWILATLVTPKSVAEYFKARKTKVSLFGVTPMSGSCPGEVRLLGEN